MLNFGEMGLGFKFYVVDNASAALARLDSSIKKFSMDAELALKKADESLNNARKSFGALGSEKVQQSLRSLGRTSLMIGSAITGGLGYAIKSFGDFEENLYTARAQAELTAKDMDDLRKVALQMAQQFPHTPEEIAAAMWDIAAAGIQGTKNIEAVTKASILYATAARTSAETASSSIISTMMQWQIPAQKATTIADQLSKTMALSKMHAEEFDLALASIGGQAAQMGQNLSSALSALIAMSNAGLSAEQAGTALRVAFSRLSDMTKPARTALNMLGIDLSDLYDKTTGKFKQWPELIATFENAMNKLNSHPPKLFSTLLKMNTKELQEFAKQTGLSFESLQEAIQQYGKVGTKALANWALTQIFGTESVRAITTSLQIGSKQLKQWQQQLENSKGQTQKMADIMKQSLNMQFKQLWSTILVAANTIGYYFAPTIKNITSLLQKFVNWFNHLSEPAKRFIAQGIAISGIFFLTSGSALLFLSKLATLAQTFTTLRMLGSIAFSGIRAISVLFGALGWQVLAVAAIVTLFTIAWNKNWFGIRSIVQKIGQTITMFFKTHSEAIKKFAFGLFTIVAPLPAIYLAWRNNWFGMRDIIQKVVDSAINILKTLPSKVWNILMQIPNILKRAASNLFKAAKNTFSNLWTGFKEALGIKSPSYIEKSMLQISKVTGMTVNDLKKVFRDISNLKAYPKLGLETVTTNVPRTYEQVNITPNVVPNIKLPLIVKTSSVPTTTAKTETESKIVTRYLAPVKLILDGRVIGETVIEFIEDYQTRKVVPTW